MSITQDELDKNLRHFKEDLHHIKQQIAGFGKADDEFYVTVKLLLELVQNAGSLFRKASVDQKRKIINLLYWNLELYDGKLKYSLKKPFDAMLENDKKEIWRW